MERVLLVLHTEPDGALGKAALESISVARALALEVAAGEWAIGIVGARAIEAGHSIGNCGATRWLAVSGREFGQSRYATDVLAVEAIWRAVNPTLVLAPGTSRWRRAIPGAAFRMGAAIDTHASEVKVLDGQVVLRRWYYRQRIEATQSRTHRPWCILTEPGTIEPFAASGASVTVESLEVSAPPEVLRTTVEGIQAPPADEQTIRPDAELLFVAGAGWTKKQADGKVHVEEAAQLILEFLRLTKCSLGSSKSLVDMASEGQAVLPFLTHLHQVGQTGSTPRHPKGLATCCHGEEPHVVGWRFIRERRAINLDPNCGWAQGKADVLYVADAFEVMREVNRLLKEKEEATG